MNLTRLFPKVSGSGQVRVKPDNVVSGTRHHNRVNNEIESSDSRSTISSPGQAQVEPKI